MKNHPLEGSDKLSRRGCALKAVLMRTLTGLVIACVAGMQVATALHEIDHRYDVTGFVLDEKQQAVANSPVSIRLGNEVIGYQETNEQGYYRIRLHLHDVDLGKTLSLKTAAGEGVIRVTVTPGDAKTERIHYANLVGGKLIERRLSRSRYPVWLYGAAAVLVLASIAVVIGRRGRRPARGRPQPAVGVRRRRKRKR
jgi:hypothetical protein